MPSFDIVSKVQRNEVDNAFNQAEREIAQRFDFKDTETELEKSDEAITIRSAQRRPRARPRCVVLQDKLVKRKVSLRFTDPGKPETTAQGRRAHRREDQRGHRGREGARHRAGRSRTPSSRCRPRSRRARSA